jgi:hypothetical protein
MPRWLEIGGAPLNTLLGVVHIVVGSVTGIGYTTRNLFRRRVYFSLTLGRIVRFRRVLVVMIVVWVVPSAVFATGQLVTVLQFVLVTSFLLVSVDAIDFHWSCDFSALIFDLA